MKKGSSKRKLSLLAASALLTCGALIPVSWAGTASTAASDSSVQTYVDQAVPGDGVLPQGVEWNRPLKAGDLTLSKPTPTTKAKLPVLAPPKQKVSAMPVGDVKAPRLADTATADPSGMPSSANVMLMQGMKNALQQSGQKLTAPQIAGSVQMPAGETPDVQTSPVGLAESPAASSDAASDVKYQPGQAPRNLMSAPASKAVAAPALNVGEPEATLENATIAAPVEAAPSETPSALVEAEPSMPALQAPAESAPEPSKPSIFGASVSEKADEPKTKGGKKKAAAAKACEPVVTSWTKTCKEAGYPVGSSGQIKGETRVECPSGNVRDVWLANSCEAAGSNVAGPKATDLTAAPVSMADAAKGAPVPASAPVASVTTSEAPLASSASLSPAAMATEAAAEPVFLPDPNAKADASCGPANGLAASTKPAGDLCGVGDPTEVTGQGPWRWSCKGVKGGMTVSCAAPFAKTAAPSATASSFKANAKAAPASEDGKCGVADGVGVDMPPAQGLCEKGLAGHVNGAGPWTWACSGTNGGAAASCVAPRKIDGACGTSAEEGTDSMPTRDLCTAGFASAVTGSGPWNWTCSGLNGGAASTCVSSPKVNAVCGPAAMTGHNEAPSEGLCTVGAASDVLGQGPWNWTCAGLHGGAKVSCTSPAKANGVCGASHGGTFEKAPSSDLCTSGKASRVTGLGPWNWNCSGMDGGDTATCTASLGSKEAAAQPVACGIAATEARTSKPGEGDLCTGGHASAITGAGPWSWSCSDAKGHNVACGTLPPADGLCGSSSGVMTSLAPVANLCASGSPGGVTSDAARKNWVWTCTGSAGASPASCAAPMAPAPQSLHLAAAVDEPKCGAAAGHAFTKAPSSELCDNGKSSAVRGNGPWSWICGLKSGKKVTCEAEKQADGVCGNANGSIQKAVPLTGLCASGHATEVQGEGPWMWSCVGTGGGGSASCSAASQAQTKVDGSCGAAANAVATTSPSANLCDTGVQSSVYGDGPWTWTCSGLNGGIAATCATSKVVPKAPPPPGPAVNGVCGAANGVAAESEPSLGLCASGTETSVSGNGPWNWSCLGANGGMTVSCTSPLLPPPPVVGVCGSSHGVTTLTAPKGGLCAAGISSAVSGKGPWVWSCSGTNGGAAVSCVAPIAGGSSGPLPSPVTAHSNVSMSSTEADEAPVPSAAPVGLVTPKLTANKKLAPMKAGTVPSIKPSKKLDLPKEASAVPGPSLVSDQGLQPPENVPDLPTGVEPIAPPPVRDTLPPSPSLKPPAIDANGEPVASASGLGRLEIDSEISTLSFPRGSDKLEKETLKSLDKLASLLQTHGNARITLTAYAATDGSISPREARRLSLSRALSVRDYLVTKGLSSNRIDVRALGANVPSGDMDRVDIKAN